MEITALKKSKVGVLIEQLDRVIAAVIDSEDRHKKQIKAVHPKYRQSAKNLVHYRALRSRDLTKLQKRLKDLGMSRLAKAESHVLPSLLATRNLLAQLEPGDSSGPFIAPEMSIKKSRRYLKRNITDLLGRPERSRHAMIMVTMPTEAAYSREFVVNMINSGMRVARINCAHDNDVVWKLIIDNIRSVSEETGIACKVAMDLGGPKIRTGAITPGPKVLKVRPRKDARGKIVEKARVWFGPMLSSKATYHIPLVDFAMLQAGQKLYFRDARNKKRTVEVVEVFEDGVIGLVDRTAVFETGMQLFVEKQVITPVCEVGELPPREGAIFLKTGEDLRLVAEPITALAFEAGDVLEEGVVKMINCSNEDVLKQARTGETVMLDDGKFAGVITAKDNKGITIKLTAVSTGGAKLRAEKGINFPDSKLSISGLTDKDKEDLEFVAEHADIVNMSFVNSTKDVDELLAEIEKLGKKDQIGVVLKIETRRAFQSLTDIILRAMQTYPIGIMIARGDLALEVGWHRIAVIQREVMKLCHAAHIPGIWATQVFENLAKNGVPSRPEMTDLWVAQRAECVNVE